MMPNYLSNIPEFAAFFATGVILLAVFGALYTLATPHSEWHLIRAGNVSAALMLAGALLGFALPVAVAMAKSEGLSELVQWGSVALLVQFAVYLALRALHRGLHQAIEQDRSAVAILAATVSVCAGLLNAGALLA